MWFDSEIEAPAVFAYHNDPWTEEDYDFMASSNSDLAADDSKPGI
jgi:hypothetical protein